MRARLRELRDWRAETGLAGVLARRHHVWRAALCDLPAQGREEREGRKGVHGRTAADDATRDVRDQWRRAGDCEPVASLAGFGLRSHPAREWQNAAFLPHHSRPWFLV